MREREHRDRGYTLTELLVVIAIFALLTGIAIPTLTRAGAFVRNDPNIAARELYSSLRGAKVHAATYRMDTAVVYGLSVVQDSVTGTPTVVIDSYAIARRMSDQEWKMLQDQASDPVLSDPDRDPVALPPEPDVAPAFVIVSSQEAVWRELPAQACVLSINNVDEPPPGIIADIQTEREGLRPITVYTSYEGVDSDNTTVRTMYANIQPGPALENQLPAASGLSAAVRALAFPAHIFKPSGIVEPQDSPVARFTLNVGPVPDASLQDRFAVAPGDVNPKTGEPVAEGVLKSPVRIELFRTTGRVKFTS